MPSFQPAFSSAFSHALHYAAYGGADIRECEEAAARVRDGDRESWHLEWVRLAERVRREAVQNLSHGRKKEGRDTFLRAAHYYRTSGHFLDRSPGGDARIATTAEASVACFAAAMRLSAPSGEAHTVEVNGTQHTAFLHRPDEEAPSPRPTLLVVGEATTALELYFSCTFAALGCGWNCFAVSASTGAEAQSAHFAQALLAAAGRLASVSMGRLAQMVFREELVPPPRLNAGYRSVIQPMGLEGAEHISPAFPDGADAAPLSFSSVGDLHGYLVQWLNGRDNLSPT